MTPPVSPVKRPRRSWYVVAAVMAAVGIAILVVLAIWIGRAVAGFSVTPFEQGDTATVTVGDRGVAIWVSPQAAAASCVSTDVEDGRPSLGQGSASTVTVTDHGRTWRRVGIVKGQPGSKHLVECDVTSNEEFGYADNPRIGRYVTFGVAGGVAATLMLVGAFVIVPVVAVKRKRTDPSTA